MIFPARNLHLEVFSMAMLNDQMVFSYIYICIYVYTHTLRHFLPLFGPPDPSHVWTGNRGPFFGRFLDYSLAMWSCAATATVRSPGTGKVPARTRFRLILSIHPSIYLSIDPSIYLSIDPSVYLSIHPPIYLSIHPSIHLSIYLSIFLI